MRKMELPPPPVPQELRETLKDHPDYVQKLQRALDNVIAAPSKLTPPFELAVWMLEDTLSGLVVDARGKLRLAESSGDAEAIQKAKARDSAVGRAQLNMGSMQDLFDYFETHRKEFQ